MSSDGGHLPRGGRHRPDRGHQRGEDDYDDEPGLGGGEGYQDSAGYGSRDGQDWPGGYEQQAGYGGSDPYSAPGGRGDQAGYAGHAGYDDPLGYGSPAGYGDQGGYGDQAGYRDPAGYGGRADYPEPGYGESGPGAAGYRQDADTNPYGPGQYGRYGPADPYGPGAPGAHGSGGDYGRGGASDPLTADPYDPDGYGDTGSLSADDGASYGPADTGSHAGWAFTPRNRDYDPDPLGPAESGSFGRPDTGSFGRPDTGGFARADSGTFGRPDTGSFGRDDEYDSDGEGDRIRWSSGPPPPPRSRGERDVDGAGLPGRGPSHGDPGGYPDWSDEPVGDWPPDEADSGLLSRRFGRAGTGGAASGGGSRGRARGRKRRRLRGKAASTIAILVVVLVLAAGVVFGVRFAHSWINNRYGDYAGPGTGSVTVTVTEGASLAELGPMLVRKGVIMAVRPYGTAAAAAANAGTLQPGLYELHHHMNAALAVKLLLSPAARIPDQVTIIEGARAIDIAKKFADRTGFKVSDFMQIIDHPPASLGLPTWAGPTAEGFLFPDTYTLAPHEKPLAILQAMVREFNDKIASVKLADGAAKVFTTPWHVLIVASMVQAEGGRTEDFGKISRVAWNRLKLGRPLQFDSTVFYAMGKFGFAITLKEEKFPSPYNTYLHSGLPPGPIGNPGLDALQSALHPAKGDWLYFIADTRPKKPPFKTYFTDNLKQLQKWQREFQN